MKHPFSEFRMLLALLLTSAVCQLLILWLALS